MKYKLIILICLVFLSAGCNKFWEKSPTIKIGGKTLNLEIATTEDELHKGLSNRKSFDKNSAMLFDFRNTDNKTPSFWMKDMNFSIDIIWIKDNKIISIDKSVPSPKETNGVLSNYSPPSEIDYVLETNAGFSDENNLHDGASVQFYF